VLIRQRLIGGLALGALPCSCTLKRHDSELTRLLCPRTRQPLAAIFSSRSSTIVARGRYSTSAIAPYVRKLKSLRTVATIKAD
jgi:hypothetical protein